MQTHRKKVLTMTYDIGKEFAYHVLIAYLLNANAYIAHPYHAWEQGLNENAKSLICQYFPKGSCFAALSDEEVSLVQHKLNSRPRKYLDHATPNDILTALPRLRWPLESSGIY